MTKRDDSKPGKAQPAPLGYTADGKPRQRAVRRYFGLTEAGQVREYHSYEAREIDVKEGRVKRITRDEASRIDAMGRAYQPPLIVSTQWSPQAAPKSAQDVPHAPDLHTAGPATQTPQVQEPKPPTYARRELIEARALLSTMEQTMEAIKARLKQLENDQE